MHLPIGISSFPKLIQEHYLYIDKTQHIYNLFLRGRRLFFLARPRKFGKSLLISTLKELFQGNHSLFKDLWIYGNWRWIDYPVIHIELSSLNYETTSELKLSLECRLDQIAREQTVDISNGYDQKSKLQLLVKKLSLREKVVIFLDDYDKPILDKLHNTKLAEAHRRTLQSFYDSFQGLDAYIKALFITGTALSFLSGLDHLNDISTEQLGAQLLGFTQEEVDAYFGNYIASIAKETGIDANNLKETIGAWYSGYQFSGEPLLAYNPFSLLQFLETQEFGPYWAETAMSPFLADILKKNSFSFTQFDGAYKLSSRSISTSNALPVVQLLYQTGYVTIKGYDEKFHMYHVSWPNKEVEQLLLT